MSWNSIPNFGDKNAKISERIHPSSRAKIIEVLYGAKDAYGRSVSPTHGDGHGHWIALEIDGTYQMLMHRYPDSEGGQQEYAYSGGTDPLTDLEEDIAKRSKICQEVIALSYGEPSSANSSRMREMQKAWKEIYFWHVPKERELQRTFREAVDRFYSARDAARNQSEHRKNSLIQQARSLSSFKDFKAAGDEMKRLMNEWKQIPSAGKDKDDLLWQQFNDARQCFFNKRQQYFDERKNLYSQNAATKRQLVSEAWNIARGSDFSKEAGERMKALMSRWKAVGPTDKSEGDQLWQDFRNANDEFWATKKQENERKHQEWEQKNQNREIKHQEWVRSMQDAISRKQSQVSHLYSQNENLHQRSYTTVNPLKRDEIGRWILENESRIRKLEIDIADISSKLASG